MAMDAETETEDKRQLAKLYKYSAVIPIYNSENIVGQTIDHTIAFFEDQGWEYELILVNDGSQDGSWEVIREKASQHPQLVAIDLLHNFGQHNAVYCGLEHSTGDYVITLDDDLQNPPSEIIHLVNKALEGHDLVIGRFRHKQHARYRRLGSRIIETINRRIFHQPKGFVLTNFRIIHRDVVDRICAYKTSYPYISGLVLMFSSRRANVWVEHHTRQVGGSNYTIFRIAALVARILFNYSAFPLHLVSMCGITTAALAFLLGTFYFVRAVIASTSVPGWTSVIVLLSWLSSINMIIMAMVGEYVVRLMQQFGSTRNYYIKEIVSTRTTVTEHASRDCSSK